MADFENQGSEEDVISIGADTTDLAAASQQITELANAFDRLAAATSAVSAAGIDPETGVIDPEKVAEAATALKTLKEFSSDARKEIFSIGAIDLSELSQELEDISRKMDLVSRAADRLRTVASKRTADKAESEKNVRSAIQSGTYTTMSPESARALFDVDDKPLMEAQEEIRRLRGELAIAASRRSGFSASSPRRAQETIDRTVRERRDAASRREEEALRSRVEGAESSVRRDPEIVARATKPLSKDEQEAAKRVKEREDRARELSAALKRANEATRNLQREAEALRRQEMLAESNAKAEGPVDETAPFTPPAGSRGPDQLGGLPTTPKVTARRLPGPGAEELPKIRAGIAAKRAEVAAARREQVELARAMGELLSSDPMEGLSLPGSSSIDAGKLKTEVRKKLLAAFSAKIKEETKSEPTEEMISDFKKIINQEQTGAVDRIVRDIVSERASRSPLFERGMSTRAARRSPRTTSAATGPASGLASEDKFPQVDAGDLASRLAKLEERKKRLQAEKEKNKSATEALESAIKTLVEADREADPEPKSTEIDEYTEDLKELDADRKKIARKPIGLRPTGEEFQKRIDELSAATVDTYDETTGEEITREVIDKKTKKKTQEVVQRPLRDDEIMEMLQDEFDASQEEISEGLRSARERNQRAKNISEAQLLARTLVKYAKNKMYQISGAGIGKTEEKTLQETIEGIIRSEGVGVSKDDLALLEKFGVASETIDAASGDTEILEKIGFGREKKGTPNRPGAQRPDDVEKTGKFQQLLLDAEKEAMETGQDIGVVLANMLAAAEDRQRKIDAQIAADQQEIVKLKEIQNDNTSAQGGAYFRAIGLPEGRIGRTDPFSRVAGRKIGPDQQEAINERARKIAARYPGGLEAMHADVLTLNPEYDAATGESPRGMAGAERIEGTVTRREIAENPIGGLFRNRSLVPNAESESGAQLSTSTISPTQAGPALEFMKELFASLKIVMAGMAETLSQGRAIKPSDVQDLGVNLSILANLYDQIQGMDPGRNEELKKIVGDMKANFAALAESEDIAKLFSPGFVTERLGKSAGLSRTEKEGLALEVAGIARGVSAGGERVVGGMQAYSDSKQRATTGVYGGRVPRVPAPADAADAAEQIKQLAGKVQLAEGEDKEKLKEQLIALIGNQISEAAINPQDLLELVKDPEIQKEIREKFARSIDAYKLRMEPMGEAGLQPIGYEVQGTGGARGGGAGRIKEGTREVIDPIGPEAAAQLVERILSIEEVVAKIAEDIDAIFSESEREADSSKRQEAELLLEERSRQLEIAERRLKQVEDRLRLQAFLSGRAQTPSNFEFVGTDPKHKRLRGVGNVSEEIQNLGAEARTEIRPIQQDVFDDYVTKPDVGSQEEILSNFTRIKKVEDLEPFGPDARAALAFSSLPVSLVRRLIKEDPELAKFATPNNPIDATKSPKGGVLQVGEEAARAVLEALEKAGVRISVGAFSNPDEADSQSLVSVMHFAEKLADDKFAAYVATGIAENVITSNVGGGGNALLNVQTPEYISYPSQDGKVKEDVAGFASPTAVVPSGVVRNLQLARMYSDGRTARNLSFTRKAVAHEYGHAITLPYDNDESAQTYMRERINRRGIGAEQAESVSAYGGTDYRELLAESYAVINGYLDDTGEEEQDLAMGEGWAESLVPALIDVIEEAKQLTKKRNQASVARRIARNSAAAAASSAPAMTTGGLRGPGAGRGARVVADRATTDDLYGDTLGNFGASFALQTSPEGAPEVTGNTPGPGFSVGGLNKRNFNLLPSDMVKEEAAPGMSKEEIDGIEERNKQKKERFRVAVLQLMQENAAFIKRALAEGREIYFGTYFDTDAGKIALDISELIPYDPNDAKSEAAARAKALADATARNQQSVARVQPSPGKGRGTGFGFAVEPEAEDAFPRTGIPAGEDAMAGYRAWTGRRYTSSNLPDAPTPSEAPKEPSDISAPDDNFDSMQKDLEETLASDPESALAKDNLRMLLEARGMEADAIARRVDEVIRGVAAHEVAAETESKKADAAESSAQNAEDELGLFEDFDESEYAEEGFIDDDTSNTSEIVEEIKGADQRTEDATERVADAKEEIAVATEEVATAVEEQAASVQVATDAVSTGSGTEAATAATTDSASEVQEIEAEIAAIDAKRAELQEKISAAFSARREAAVSAKDKLRAAFDVLMQMENEELADEVVAIEIDTDREMAQREARFRRTKPGRKLTKTGEYANEYVPEVYGPESEEYKRLISEGFKPDEDNAFTERDMVFSEKSAQFRHALGVTDYGNNRNLASKVGLPPVNLPGAEAPRQTIDEIRGYIEARSAEQPEYGVGEPLPEDVEAARQALVEFQAAIEPVTEEIDSLGAELRTLTGARESLRAEQVNLTPVKSESANDEAERNNKDVILQKQIIPEQLAPIIDLLNKTLAIADRTIAERGQDTSGMTAKDKAQFLESDPSGIGRKLEFLINAIEMASGTDALKQGQLRFPGAVLPSDVRGTTPDARVKSGAKLTGMSPEEVADVSGVLQRIQAALRGLEAQAATGEVDLEALAASLQNVSSEARETASFLTRTTTSDQQKIVAAGDAPGGAGGSKPPTATGGGMPPGDPDNDWRKIRAVVPDTEMISRGLKDLAALQNRFNELSPTILHVGDANRAFSKSLDESAKKSQEASEAIATLTNTNVGALRAIKTQVSRAATFLVLQQLGREIGGVFEHLQSGVFQFNQVLENTTVGFNTLFANTLQARAAVGNELVPKLNEAGVQIGFMREQSVEFADAINYTADAAKGMVDEIRDIANVTPFRFKPLVEAALKMKAFGFEATEIPGMINSISNAVAALGGEDEKIDRIAYALGQMNSAGRVYQNDMMQLANAGIAGYRMLSEKMLTDLTAMKMRALGTMKDIPEETAAEFDRLQGMLNSASFKKSFGSIDDMIRTLQDPKRAEGLIRNLAKRGFLIGSTAARAITEGMDKQYQGSADRLSRTMTGALSTIKDLSQNFMATAFQPLFASVRDTIVEIGQFMLNSKEITKFVDSVRDRMVAFMGVLADFGPALQAAGQIFLNIFVGGIGSALDKGTQFGSVITGIVANLGPGLRLIGDILTNDVGKGLVVATLAFSLFSKIIATNPLVATITLLVAAISGIAKAIEEDTLGVGTFVKMFIPSIEQLFKVIGDALGTIMQELSEGGLAGFIAGLSLAIDVLMPLLTVFLATLSVILKVITPFAKPLGIIIGLFLALKTAMMAYDLAGSLMGKVMNGIGGVWTKVNGAIDQQISKVKQTAAAYDELKKAKIEAEDYKTNDRGQYLDDKGRVTKDKSKAALNWGPGEKVNSYGMNETKGRAAQAMLDGRGFVPGLLAMERGKQQAMDYGQNMMGVRPEFGKGFHLSHGDSAMPHTEAVITNRGIEGTYGYLDQAESRLTAFRDANQGKTVTGEDLEKLRDLEEAARLKQEYSKAGVMRFAGLDEGKSVTGKADINKNAGAYSMDNMLSAITIQKQINWIINTSYKQIEEAGAEIAAINKELDILKKQMESGEITSEDYETRKQSALDRIQQVKAKPVNQKAVAVIGGLIEGQGGDATDLLDKSAAGRPINIPKGSAEAIKKLPDKTRNIIMARVLEAQTKGDAFLTDKELNDIVTGALGDARGKAALKGMTTGISGKIAQMLTNLYNKVAAGVPKQFKTIERGGGATGMKEIDSRGGDYYYVNEETGMLSNRKVGKKELASRERIKSLPGAGILGKIGGAVGMAGVAAGLASGASRLAGQVAPILSAPIIGPFMDMLPKEMTNILRQKAGPFQAMASGIGTAAGTALGQALIPIPGLGAALGGMIGGALAEFVGNAVDNAIAGGDIAKKKAAALLEEAQALGFTPEQAKVVAMQKTGIEDGGGFLGLFGLAGAKNPLKDISDVYTTNDKFDPMSEEEYQNQVRMIEAADIATPGFDKEAAMKTLNDQRAARAAPGAFDRAQAEFMNSGMDAEMLARYSNVAPEDLFAKMQLLELQDAHKDELKSIEGKIARREELSGAEQKLKNELDRLTAAAAASPLGMYGTLMDPKLFSPKQFTDNLDATLRRDQYNAEDVKAGVTDSTGKLVTDGQTRSGFADFSTLMKDVGIQGLTRDAGFGGKTSDALAALGFDYSKVTRDTTNEEILQMMRETLRVGVQARIRGDELMPKVDMTLTRLEMMEEYGGEAGYKMFDETTDQRAKYQATKKTFEGMGGDARLGILQKFKDAAIAPRTIVTRVAPEGVNRDQIGGRDAVTSVTYKGESMLTTAESQELEKLTAAQKAMNDARYIGLTVNLKYRMSTAGQSPEEVAKGVAAEKAFAEFQLSNQTKLTAAVNAGKNATAEQLALIKEETRLRDAGYVQKNVELKIGDALQASEAAGLQITNKDLKNNTALVEILMAKQQVIDANGTAAMSSVMASVAEARAEDIVTEIKLKQITLEGIQQQSEEAGRNATVAFAKWEASKTEANYKAWEHASKQQLGYQTSAEGVQKQIAALSEKAAKFLDDAAKANPLKLTKKEIDEIKKLIAKDPGSILGGDGGAAANKALEKSLDLLNKISSVAAKAYERMRKEQQRTHDEYVKQLDEQEKRINERYQQRSDIQSEENLQAQLQIAGLQMRSDSADPLEAAKSFYDAKQALEQFYIDQQRDAELKVVADEKERYTKQFSESSEATQAIYDAAMTRLNSRFDFAQSVLNGDEKMAGKMNDALRMTMFGGKIKDSELITGDEGQKSTAANDEFNAYKNAGISIALQKQYKVQNVAGLYKKYTAIKPGRRTTAQKAVISKYNNLLALARREGASNSMIDAVSGLTGEQDITMSTGIDADLAKFESDNRDAIAAALEAGDNITEAQETLLAELEEKQSLAKVAANDALLAALGGISAGTLYNADTAFTAGASAFKGGIWEPKTGTGLTYGGKAINSQDLAKQYLKIYKGDTEESGLAATFANEAIMAQLRYKDQTGKEYSGAGNILAYLTDLVNKMGGGSLGISKLSADQGGLYQYLMSLVSAKNTFTTAQKTAVLAQRTLEQGLNDFEQATGVDINIANLAEADVTDKQFTEYFNALGKTFEDNAARDAAIQKMRDVLRDTYGQALLAVDVEQYAKFADSSDKRIGTLSGVANSLKDVMDQIGNVMSSPNQMTTLDKLLFGANFDPSNLSGANNPISNLQFGKTQIDYVTTAITATRDAFESSMNSIKSYASELSGPLGAFNQQSVTGADALTEAMGQTASSFSLATSKVNEYATALAAAAAARASLGVNATLATGLATSTTPTSATVTAGANNTFNITVSNASGMDAEQLAAELARLIARQAGSSVN
jgi:tape measure domain-containing protein